LIDIGVHLIDLAMHMSGLRNPTRVWGRCRHDFSEENYQYETMWSAPVEGGTFDVEDGVQATIRFANGETVLLDVAWASHLPEQYMHNGLLIEGDKGAMVVDLWGDTVVIGSDDNGKPVECVEKISVEDAWVEAFREEHRAFAETVATNALHVEAGTGEDGRLVQMIIDGVYASDQMKQEVAIVI